MTDAKRLLYCHCAYAKVVPAMVKHELLERIAASDRDFEAVPDLCEMSARKDPALARLASPGNTKIAACYPRAVKWLFHAAGKGRLFVNRQASDNTEAFDRRVHFFQQITRDD